MSNKLKRAKRPKVEHIDITDMLTPQGLELPVGQILKFTKTDLRIVKKKGGRVFAVETKAYTREEIAQMEAEAMHNEAQMHVQLATKSK